MCSAHLKKFSACFIPRYVYYMDESPSHSHLNKLPLSAMGGFYNWTMTYTTQGQVLLLLYFFKLLIKWKLIHLVPPYYPSIFPLVCKVLLNPICSLSLWFRAGWLFIINVFFIGAFCIVLNIKINLYLSLYLRYKKNN